MVIPSLLLLAAELAALAAVGYVSVRVVLRQDDERMALVQGLVVGPVLCGVIVNVELYIVPGLAGAAVGWGVMPALGVVLVWRASHPIRPRPRMVAGFAAAALALFWLALASQKAVSVPDPTVQLGQASSNSRGRVPAKVVLEPWNACAVSLRHTVAGRAPDAAGWAESGVRHRAAGRRYLGEPRPGDHDAAAAASSSFAAAVTAPLLITASAWTFTWVGEGILEIPVLSGRPPAEIGASLLDVYWPSPKQTWEMEILKQFREAALALWARLEAAHLWRAGRARSLTWSAVIRTSAGLALALLMLLVAGRFAGILIGAAPSGLSLGWNEHQNGW